MSAALTYVYCLVRAPRRPGLRRVPAGMPGGGDLRLLPIEPADQRAWLVVSSVPSREYGERALQRGLQDLNWVGPRALAHEAVIEHFLSAPAVLPMQLFALFTSDDRALAQVAGDRRRVNRILDRIERQHEWGLRLTWDERAVREQVEQKHQRRAPAVDAAGTAYLARKRDLLDVNRAQLVAARAEANRLYRAVSRAASAARRRTETEQASAGSRLLLDAAFLVPVKRTAAFRSAVRRSAKQLEGSAVAVSLTGPWPPYNFV